MRDNVRRHCALVLIALGVMLIAWGIGRGELDTVLRKAATICLECIGIG